MAAISQGPFTLVPLGMTSYTDPAVNTPANVKVQLQNNSNMALSVQIGGANFSIAPFTASTIPTNTSPTMTVLCGTQTAPTGTLTLAWLQTSDEAPMPDGPIVGTSTVSTNMVILGKGTIPAGPSVSPVITLTIPVTASNRSVWVAIPASNFAPAINPNYAVYGATGNQSGYNYNAYYQALYAGTGSTSRLFRIPIIEGIDQTISVPIYNSTAFAADIYWGVDNANTDVAVSNYFNSPLYVQTNPAIALSVATVAGAPLDVVSYGGATLSQLINNPGGTILAAPGAGQSYRLHSVSVNTPNNVGGDRFTFYEGTGDNVIATLFYGSKESEQLNGLLVKSLVGVTPSHLIATVFNVYYDTVTTPSIS